MRKIGLSLLLATVLLISLLALLIASAQANGPDGTDPSPTPERRAVSAWGQLPPTRLMRTSLTTQSSSLTPTFYATDFQTFECFQVQATLEYTGVHSYIYLDVSEVWARSLVTATAEAFDAMWPTLVTSFGSPPDRTGEARFGLLLLDIRDQYYHDPMATSYIPAYFDPIDQTPGPCSNNQELIYVDLNPTSPPGLDGRRGMAHSLVNAIQWQADPAEALWLDESLAYLGEYVAGLGHRPEITHYLANPRNPLTGHTGASGDAGQQYLWGLYLYEQFGPTAVYNLTQNPLTGMTAVETVTGQPSAASYHRWALANLVDAGAGTTPYGYAALDIIPGSGNNVTTFQRPAATAVVVPPPAGYPGEPPYRRPAGLDIKGTFQGVGYHASDYYRLYPEGVRTWIVDASAYQPFGQGVYSDSQMAVPNWTTVITIPTVTLGSAYVLEVAASRSTGALGDYCYQIWPGFPPWWPGWDDGDDDEDDDCIPDWVECPDVPCPDTDRDGTPDYQDLDSDQDGLTDGCEYGSTACPVTGPARDTDNDGLPDWHDPDDDNDGIPTALELEAGQTCNTAADCDEDGLPNYRDLDSDDDGLLDQYEWDADGDGQPDDTDGDGVWNVCDPDDDGDCTLTAAEAADPNGDGNPADAVDTNGNGRPDYLDLAGSACGGIYLPIIHQRVG